MISSIPNDESLLTSLEVFLGETSNAEARIYARLPQLAGEYSLRGSVTGPYCQYNRTLPATIPLVDRGPGAGLLAQAIVPDPCFWSPELPMVYRAKVELHHAGQTVARAERLLGVKPLGVRGQQLVHEGKKLVLRAVRHDHVPVTPLADWREQSATVDIDEPDDAWLEEASHVGVWVIARIRHIEGDLSAAVRRLARWPAVAVIAVPSNSEARLSQFPGNCILAQIAPSDRSAASEPWCQAVIATVATADSRPVLIQRDGRFENLAEARRACDQLQADFASRGQFAGYIV
jgi:hypothetical protein